MKVVDVTVSTPVLRPRRESWKILSSCASGDDTGCRSRDWSRRGNLVVLCRIRELHFYLEERTDDTVLQTDEEKSVLTMNTLDQNVNDVAEFVFVVGQTASETASTESAIWSQTYWCTMNVWLQYEISSWTRATRKCRMRKKKIDCPVAWRSKRWSSEFESTVRVTRLCSSPCTQTSATRYTMRVWLQFEKSWFHFSFSHVISLMTDRYIQKSNETHQGHVDK